MDYTEQFIRLNCSLMSDYKMMKLNADMKCMGLGLYLETILFLRKQQEYKHDFNELDLLADQWGALPWKICNILLRTSICFSLQRTGISDVCIWTR